MSPMSSDGRRGTLVAKAQDGARYRELIWRAEVDPTINNQLEAADCRLQQVAGMQPASFDFAFFRGYAVIPGVGTSAMPVASVPSIKSYIHQATTSNF